MTPVYPKEHPERRQEVLNKFYKQVRETKWDTPEEKSISFRGRKPKKIELPIVNQLPQTKSTKIKDRYNWL
jgi:hypothetical protein